MHERFIKQVRIFAMQLWLNEQFSWGKINLDTKCKEFSLIYVLSTKDTKNICWPLVPHCWCESFSCLHADTGHLKQQDVYESLGLLRISLFLKYICKYSTSYTVHYHLNLPDMSPVINKPYEDHAFSPEVWCGPQNSAADPARLFLHHPLHQELWVLMWTKREAVITIYLASCSCT